MTDRTLSRKYKQPSSSPCPVLSRAPASCSARCCAPTLKSRRNPVRRSAVGAPESPGAGEGGGKSCHLWTGPDPGACCCLFFFFSPHRRTETSLYLTGKSQPTKLDKQCDLRLRKNTAQNKLLLLQTGRPTSAGEPAPPVCHGPTWGGNRSQQIISGSQGRVQVPPRVVKGFPGGPQHNDDDLCRSVYQGRAQDFKNTEIMSPSPPHKTSTTCIEIFHKYLSNQLYFHREDLRSHLHPSRNKSQPVFIFCLVKK